MPNAVPRRYLVTGANGFLGSYIVEQLLARGDNVRVVARRKFEPLPGVEVVHGDLLDSAVVTRACAGMEVVFHAAAVSGIWGPWDYYYRNNTVATQNIVAACVSHGVRGLVYTSSPSVTFDGTDQCGVDETVPYPTHWLCHYPHSKALAEAHVLAANGTDGLLTCSLRPHLIWGPRDHHLIPRLLDRARRGRLRRVGDGSNLMDVVYVENAAQAHLQAADRLLPGSPVCGRAYFISQGEPMNCWGWIDELLKLYGLSPVQKFISFTAAWRVGATLEAAYSLLRLKSEPPMTRFLAAQLAKNHYFNIERARRDLGYEPRISVAEGMQRLLAS